MQREYFGIGSIRPRIGSLLELEVVVTGMEVEEYWSLESKNDEKFVPRICPKNADVEESPSEICSVERVAELAEKHFALLKTVLDKPF